MKLKALEINGFKSFGKKVDLSFDSQISAIVGPNGSGKSNIAEAFRFVLGEQSIKSLRGKKGEDLIYSGTGNTGRLNRASVKLIFDNSDRMLNIDFEEVALERTVHRDGINEYLINGSPVRLKDIVELLSMANIGTTGHHIISQGEADRILNSSIKDRRLMLEDALGLKSFQYKKIESQKRLEKTRENISHVESLRKEIAPHLKFLRKQMEKLEKVKEMQVTLLGDYKVYLKKESLYLSFNRDYIESNLNPLRHQISQLTHDIEVCNQAINSVGENRQETNEIQRLNQQLDIFQKEKDGYVRRLGNIEGQIDSLIRIIEKQSREQKEFKVQIPRHVLQNAFEEVSKLKQEAEMIEDLGVLRKLVNKACEVIDLLINEYHGSDSQDDNSDSREELDHLKKEKSELEDSIKDLENRTTDLSKDILKERERLEKEKLHTLTHEKKLVELLSLKNETQGKLSKWQYDLQNLERDESLYKQELTEATILVGREVLNFEKETIFDKNGSEINLELISNEPREIQIEFKKQLERLKIRLEEFGGAVGEDTIKEFNEVSEREVFLAKEIEDLEKSAMNLESMIGELEEKINERFKDGLQKINLEFQKFFALMFGGGEAKLVLIKPEIRRKSVLSEDESEDEGNLEEREETEEGLDIQVNLPRKKIKSLLMLSGGERALTSIALIFAMSQVNPPPFLILDETDAALDEANSRKYGDMIENLASYSQLILITHNRETMSRAGILYGVTMNQGVSQLLSIKFDEAVRVAK